MRRQEYTSLVHDIVGSEIGVQESHTGKYKFERHIIALAEAGRENYMIGLVRERERERERRGEEKREGRGGGANS